MPKKDKKQQDRNAKKVKVEKRADILQATFEHYFKMAMDHHTKAATTSNILLVIVGAIIALIGHDNEVCGIVDSVGGLAVFIIGLFGAVWVWKQHERYFYWQHIAYEYQRELVKIVPMFKTGEDYDVSAKMKSAKKFGPFFAKKIDRYLWLTLHGIIAITGLWLLSISMICLAFHCR